MAAVSTSTARAACKWEVKLCPLVHARWSEMFQWPQKPICSPLPVTPNACTAGVKWSN